MLPLDDPPDNSQLSLKVFVDAFLLKSRQSIDRKLSIIGDSGHQRILEVQIQHRIDLPPLFIKAGSHKGTLPDTTHTVDEKAPFPGIKEIAYLLYLRISADQVSPHRIVAVMQEHTGQVSIFFHRLEIRNHR